MVSLRVAMLPILALTLSLALAGCLSASVAPTAEDALATASASLAPDFGVAMNGCREGGGVSLYNMKEGTPGPVEPFILADVQDDVGHPLIASYGEPIPPGGATNGIWHASVVCDSYSYQGEERGSLQWGWVGMKIQPPAWDTSGIERQFFIADLSFMDEEIVGSIRDTASVHASVTWGSRIEWLAPSVMHTVLDDEEHGVFETHARMKAYRAFEPQPTRFWMLAAQGGDHGHEAEAYAEAEVGSEAAVTYRAVSFDLVTSGGEDHMVADVTGILSHTRTDAHGAVPGAAGNLAAVLYTGFERTIVLGPSPDIVFNATWTH